ncbi:MAG: hypothetical protein ACI9R3_004490 [Verrucomicrobiales bacterium]|jgi:hypothetical protein
MTDRDLRLPPGRSQNPKCRSRNDQPALKDVLADPSRPERVAAAFQASLVPWERDGTRISGEKHNRYAWLTVVIISVLSLILLARVVYLLAHLSQESPTLSTTEAVERSPLEVDPLSIAKRTLVKAFATSSVEQLLDYVRHPDRVAPLMEDYYARRPFAHLKIDANQGANLRLQPFNMKGREFWIAKITDEAGIQQSVVLEESDNTFKLDWETYVHYNPIDWSTYVDSRPSGIYSFRCYAELGEDFRTSVDQGESFWIRLTSKDSDRTLRGRAKFSVGQDWQWNATRSKKHPTPVILELRFPEMGETDGQTVEVVKVTQFNWLVL